MLLSLQVINSKQNYNFNRVQLCYRMILLFLHSCLISIYYAGLSIINKKKKQLKSSAARSISQHKLRIYKLWTYCFPSDFSPECVCSGTCDVLCVELLGVNAKLKIIQTEWWSAAENKTVIKCDISKYMPDLHWYSHLRFSVCNWHMSVPQSPCL